MTRTATYIAVVQNDDEPANDDTHIVTIAYDEHGMPTVELSDGSRITAVELVHEKAAA